jgi:glutathionylspermidine synthase
MPEVRTKAQRRADREAVGAYHEQEQAKLLEHVREGFARWDADEIDAFQLDELIHHYHRASQKLWSMCVGAGGHVSHMARLLEWQSVEGEETDWWAAGAPGRRRDP